MASLPQKLPYELMLTKWASALNPFISRPTNQMNVLEDIDLANGTTVINHRLGRKMQGWTILDIDGAAQIYRSQPFNDLTLTLVSNAAVTVNLGVF